ncbi:uncharacterized protein LOC113211783 [Frankliniella occidentalis]|uniref:Uncharacterized protein LOC113211783 n=1 Tax=Frankliniella occidentalis TaxID=133901 RepID=A0A6J1SXS2_FRAOC|nr:uncharacterized protein LOC113211783 [Frankliniella occidentalis]
MDFTVTTVVMTLALSTAVNAQRGTNGVAGPFRLIADHIEECPQEMQPRRKLFEMTVTAFRDRRDVDLWHYSANGTTYITVDNNLTALANFASWSSTGGWKDNFFRFTLPRACATAKARFPDLWRRAMIALFNDPDRDCPFPPGYYSVRNVSTDFHMKQVRTFFYGKYRGTGTLINSVTKEVIACKRGFFSIVPKTQKHSDKL